MRPFRASRARARRMLPRMATPPGQQAARLLRALVVDDEAPAAAELAWLLEQDDRIGQVRTVHSGADALRALDGGSGAPADVIFCDIRMPGLDGMELARVLSRFADPPLIVFVTAYGDHALGAFDVSATDYVMKPVRPERLAEAVRKVVERVGRGGSLAGATGAPVPGSTGGPASAVGVPLGGVEQYGDPATSAYGTGGDVRTGGPGGAGSGPGAVEADETIPVELGGVTRFVQRSEILYVQAQGDYARLHTASGSHLVRISLTHLEERWGPAGFARIHRSTLVSLPAVTQVRTERGRCVVVLGDTELQVSRRHTRELRDRLLRLPGRRRGT